MATVRLEADEFFYSEMLYLFKLYGLRKLKWKTEINQAFAHQAQLASFGSADSQDAF